MSKLVKYRIWCNTDNKYEYTWDEEGITPTKCPKNTVHDVDNNSITIVETMEDNSISIKTEEIETQGLTQVQSFEVDVLDTVGTYTKHISFPIPINVIRGKWFNKSNYDGDVLEFVIAEDSIIGAITSNVENGDTIINVSATVLANTKLGYYIKCEGQDWGRVLSINTTNNQITIENAATASITATGSEYILQTIKLVPHLYLEGTETMMVLEGGIGSQYIPEGVTMTIKYHNNTGVAKKYSAILEYFY